MTAYEDDPWQDYLWDDPDDCPCDPEDPCDDCCLAFYEAPARPIETVLIPIDNYPEGLSL